MLIKIFFQLGIWTHNAVCLTAAEYNAKNISQYTGRLTTTTSGNILVAELVKAGFTKPDYYDNEITGWAAHHIIPKSKYPRGKLNEDTQDAQDILARHNIDINSAANGVWLPQKKGVPEVEVDGTFVSTHNGYFEYVANKLRAVQNDRNKVLQVVEQIRGELLTGVIKLGNV